MAEGRRNAKDASDMVEPADRGKDCEGVPCTPIGLIDVYIPAKQTAAVVILILLFSAFLFVGALIPFNIPIMSRVTMLALSAVVGGAIGSAFNSIRNL